MKSKRTLLAWLAAGLLVVGPATGTAKAQKFGSSSRAGSKPSQTSGGGSYDAGAAAAQRHQESRAAYSSGRSYSSGTAPSTSASPPNVAAGRAASGKSYSSSRPSSNGSFSGSP